MKKLFFILALCGVVCVSCKGKKDSSKPKTVVEAVSVLPNVSE